MQPTLCSRCKKNVAVVFISRTNEKNETVNEGLCLKCAAQLGLPQVEDMMKRMGISPDDLEGLNNEMMQAFGGAEEMSDLPEGDGEDDEESGKTATFPFLNRLFGSGSPAEKPEEGGAAGGKSRDTRERKADKKKKYLAAICAAPSILSELGILKGRKACAYPSFEEGLDCAQVVHEAAVTDGHVTTGRGMGAAIPFALKLTELLCGTEKANEIAESIVYA
mgnify:FL=1